MSKLLCLVCNHEVTTSPLREWKYRAYDVKRYQCQNCKSKFNLYESPKRTYTIPKPK